MGVLGALDEVADVVRVGRRMTIEPKGAKAPMAICEVTGIGGPYEVHLPRNTREPVRLATSLPCRYRKIERKVTTRELCHFGPLTFFRLQDITQLIEHFFRQAPKRRNFPPK